MAWAPRPSRAPHLGAPPLLRPPLPPGLGTPSLLPSAQDSSLRARLGSFSHPKSRGQQMLRASPSGHAPLTPPGPQPPHLQCGLRGGSQILISQLPPPQDPQHLSPEFLQKWGISHTLAEKGSHLPPKRSGVLGLRAPPRAVPVCSLPLDLCVCPPGLKVKAVWSLPVSLSSG